MALGARKGAFDQPIWRWWPQRAEEGETTVQLKRAGYIVGAVLAAQFTLIGLAQAQGNCQWYAATALKQQQENERLKCGFTGVAWHADLGRHLTWCKGVSPDEWKSAAQERDAMLAKCAKR